ncbi:ferredoxin [Nocardia asteroides]|uniref:ferredoxin n=1 Tax=Nocardia asteroides TaxID=1824 RepID=UPI001E45CEC0|nr:ferredoxin [Nocardia asteroides]UGT61311.1 ferredoxin [Nocardia asteroides]
MKVDVNWTLCEANGVCAGIAPEVFDLDDQDNLHVLHEEVPDALAAGVREAVAQCPRAALTATE